MGNYGGIKGTQYLIIAGQGEGSHLETRDIEINIGGHD
jgi:hypothetical protein